MIEIPHRPTADEAAEARPPRDYPFTEWQDAGPYAVPEDLRPFYAAAEPSDDLKRGYIEYGATITENEPVTRQRLVAPGRDDGEPIVTEETEMVPTLRDLHGAADYPTWLHLSRRDLAVAARRRADARAVTESRYGTCDVCGVRHGGVQPVSVRPHSANGVRAHLTVYGCAEHLPVLERSARAAADARAAGNLLPDGRTAGDVADAVVTDRLARLDGAS
jgi:hypothetical protein